MPRQKVVVITGASAGVGRATARRFGHSGAAVGLLARGQDGLKAAKREIESAGGKAIVIPTDVSDSAQIDAAADQVEREIGPIDIWINNAMTTIFSPVERVEPHEFKRATEVTYLGTVYGTMAALKRMRPRNRGVIVQVGSALAYRAIPLQAPYCGAKFAIRGFTDSLRSELLNQRANIQLTMVQLPGLNTPQFDWCETRLPNQPQPVAPIFQPEVAAEGIFFAAHHPRRELWVGRSSLITIIGNKFLPRMGDHYLAHTAIEGQQTEQPVPADRPSNLWKPVTGDHGARGRFNDQAESHSAAWELSKRRRSTVAAAGGLLAGILIGWSALK